MKKKIKALMHLFKAPEFWIIIFLLLYATVTRYPLLSHLSTHTYQAGADYYIFTWILSWNCHALETFDFAHYWATNAMHPYPYALAFSENLSGLLPIAFPIWLLSHNPILTINLTLQLLLCFTALSTYLVLRKLIGNGLSALTGTIIFTFCPYTLLGYTIGHPHMVALMWLPLICYANWRFWQKSGKWKHWFIIVFFWLWNFLISLYVGILMTIFFGLWNLFWFFYERPLFTVKKIIKWLFGVLLIWLLMIPVFLVYYNVTQDMGAIRTLEHQLHYTGYVWSWFTTQHDNWLWGQELNILPPSRILSHEDAMFPGIIAICLFIASYFIKNIPCWLKSMRWSAVVLALCAMGPATIGIPFTIPLPYTLLWYIFPPLHAIRNPHRLSIFALLGAGFIAAFALQKLPPLSKKYLVIKIAVLAILCVELLTYSVPQEATHPGDAGVYKMLAKENNQLTIIELPMPRNWIGWMSETKPLINSTYHWNTIINGLSGLWPPVQFQAGRELKDFPSQHTISLLQSLGVDTVLINENRYGKRLPGLLRQMKSSQHLHFEQRIASISLWRLDKGEKALPFIPEQHLHITGPGKLVEGMGTLNLGVTPAAKNMVFNHKAPARWKFPIADPWLVTIQTANNGSEATRFEWETPGLFHLYNYWKSFTVTAQTGEKEFLATVILPGQTVQLHKKFIIVSAQRTTFPLPPYLKLPQGFEEIPLDKLQGIFEPHFSTIDTVKQGELLEGTIEVRNPGPYYWSGGDAGIKIETVVQSGDYKETATCALPHDMYPGDITMLPLKIRIRKIKGTGVHMFTHLKLP